MAIHFASQDELHTWDARILQNPDKGTVFQSREMAEQKQMGGWTARYIVDDTVAITVLERFILGVGKIWYVPKGPGVTRTGALYPIITSLRPFANAHGVFVMKVEPEIIYSDASEKSLARKGLIHIRPIQPNYATVILNLRPELDDILAAMPQKGRYAIKRAQRDGVRVTPTPATTDTCQKMYDLMMETAEGRFAIREYRYYESFWQRFSAEKIGQFFFAYYQDTLVAAAFVMCFGDKATYKDGASIRAKTAYGASHALQWEAIKWAKQQGATSYDFCGAPPVRHLSDATHPHYGIGLFKTSFQKEITEYVGTYDVVIKRYRYWLWRHGVERLVGAWYSRIRHTFFY